MKNLFVVLCVILGSFFPSIGTADENPGVESDIETVKQVLIEEGILQPSFFDDSRESCERECRSYRNDVMVWALCMKVCMENRGEL